MEHDGDRLCRNHDNPNFKRCLRLINPDRPRQTLHCDACREDYDKNYRRQNPYHYNPEKDRVGLPRLVRQTVKTQRTVR